MAAALASRLNFAASQERSIKVGTNGFDDEWRGAVLSDIHGSPDYRANLIKVMAQRAVAAAMGAVEGLLSRQEVG